MISPMIASEDVTMTPAQRAALMAAVRAGVAAGQAVPDACRAAGISFSTWRRWSVRHAEAGLDGLSDLPRSGRPPLVTLDEAESAYLRRAYLKSNLREGAGSMTAAARWAAKSPDSPLRQETRAAILAPRASKHALLVEVRRACRASEAEVRRYREGAKAGQNDGIYTPGWLRMTEDGSRRLLPGERWVGDDASVNVGVVVPWARGGDACSDRWGCRVARFQLLMLTDCATDMIVGYNYVMRPSDGYRAEDVVSTLWRVSMMAGYAPNQCVMEGGSWQAQRTLAYLDAAGIRMISAKGRPNQKLIESVFNRLWTVMSIELPARGQVGRFRGEMNAENTDWRRCREGVADPRAVFPELTEFLAALDRSIKYLNAETVESRGYGSWTPSEVYAAQAVRGHALPQGLRRFALPVREVRKLRRSGMVAVRAECPFGWPHTYMFALDDAYMFDGADVRVSFDPGAIHHGAHVELASDWHDMKAGRVIAAEAQCVSPAPELFCSAGEWRIRARDGRQDASEAKRTSRARIGAQAAAFDERGVRARHGEHERRLGDTTQSCGIGEDAEPAVPALRAARPVVRADEWERLEREAGVMIA
jgi:hypothetical protein